jgi:phosphate starvation-inducible PhoH-like protein
MTTAKKPVKKRKEYNNENEITEAYKRNFDLLTLKLKNQLPLTDNQRNFYFYSQNEKTNILFVDGPAGSAKSYVSIYSALELLKNKKVDKIIYIRTVVESSSKSIGYLKGDEHEKFAPYTMVLNEKCSEIMDKSSHLSLIEHGYIKAIPVNFVRGLTFHNSAVIIDEAQNMNKTELTTVLTRCGRNTKYFICGDSKQTDIKDSGFNKVFDLFDTEFSRKNHIHCIKFDTSDVVRSPILRHITQVLGV